MRKIIITILAVISIFLLCFIKVTAKENTIRFRVIANSDNKQDQYIKKEIVKEILPLVNKKYTSIEDARNNINSNIEEYNKIIEEVYKKNSIQSTYKINYGINYFPRKQIYKADNYESLVIELGSSKGKNFWCVLFPPICNMKSEDYEYKSFIKELINKIKNK